MLISKLVTSVKTRNSIRFISKQFPNGIINFGSLCTKEKKSSRGLIETNKSAAVNEFECVFNCEIVVFPSYTVNQN
jgi:hypothetical protein